MSAGLSVGHSEDGNFGVLAGVLASKNGVDTAMERNPNPLPRTRPIEETHVYHHNINEREQKKAWYHPMF